MSTMLSCWPRLLTSSLYADMACAKTLDVTLRRAPCTVWATIAEGIVWEVRRCTAVEIDKGADNRV